MSRLRIASALAGFGAALLSVTLDDPRLGWLAIALLTISLILRLILRQREGRRSETDRPV
jgi:multisubunit Na+/H+ antiporter MnhB subunit